MSRTRPTRIVVITSILFVFAAIAVNANWGSGSGFSLFTSNEAASESSEIAADYVPDGLSASDWDGIRAAYEAARPLSITAIGQEAYLKPGAVGTSQTGDNFGISVAVSGDTVVVGAPYEDSSTTGVNSTPNESAGDSGAAYVFTRSGGVWTQQAYLKPAAVGTTQAGDFFGYSVAVAGDTVVVGAYGEDSDTLGVNSTPNDTGGVNFDSGAAYVFTRTVGAWTQDAYLKPAAVGTTQEGDRFGWSVAVAGDTVVVGAFTEDSSTTGVNSTPNESSGNSGAAYVFTRSVGVWTQEAYLKPAAVGTTQAGDNFGYSVAVAGDTVVVGANVEDSSTTGVNSIPNESSSNSGAAYVFTRSAGVWTQDAYLKPAAVGTTQADDRFGWSVAVTSDTVVIGAVNEDGSMTGVNSTPDESSSQSGAAYVFFRSAGVWTQQAYLKPAAVGTTQAGDNFGYSVAVAGDTVVVGAPYEDSSTMGVNSTPDESAFNSGAAYVFTRSAGVWTQDAYLKPATVGTTQSDLFAFWVAVAGDTVVVGTVNEDSSMTGVNSTPNESSSNAGAAYTFAGLGAPTSTATNTSTPTDTPTDTPTNTATNTPTPLVCPAGSYFNGSVCVLADPGFYVPTAGATSQTPCPAGKYQPNSGAISCLDADAGNYVSSPGSTSQTPCPVGRYQPNSGAISCLLADPGSFVANQGSVAQTLCAAGTYQPNSGAASCLLADPGSIVANAGSIAQTLCAAGTYQPSSGASACLLADAGFYVPTSGATAQIACPSGTTSGPGATVCTAMTATATNTPTPTPLAIVSGTVAYGNAIGAPSVRGVPNVLVSAAGSPALSDTTGAPGTYSLTGFGAGSYTITPSKSGGQNGSITSFDAARVSQYLTGNTSFTSAQTTVADVSGAGGISSYDAALIGRYAAALGSPTGSSGSWLFNPASSIHPSITMDVTEDYAALLMGDTSGNWGDPSPFRPARTVDSEQWREALDSGPERGVAVELQNLSTMADKEVVIPINVQGVAGKGIIAYEFDLRYDPTVIQPMKQPVDVTGTVSRGFTVVTNATEPGLLRVVVYGAFPIDENGILLNLRFTAVGKAGSISPLTFERIMFNEGEPGVIASDGKVELF